MIETRILDGRTLAGSLEEVLRKKVSELKGRKPNLAVVLVGDHKASKVYIERKRSACKRVGIESHLLHLHESTTQAELKLVIESLNSDPFIDGILIQLPLPHHLAPLEAIQSIDPTKDVDGLHPLNQGKLLQGSLEGFIPCTPLGVKTLLDHYSISVSFKHVVVLGRSNIVGKPMAALLTQINPGYDATVTVLHRSSPSLKEILRMGDILIIAAGQPHLIRKEMVKEGAVVIDIGITKLDNAIVGDVAFEELIGHASDLTPVPGGVGPMTIAMLLENTWKAFSCRK